MISLLTGDLDEIAVVGAHCDDIAIGMGGTLLTLREPIRGYGSRVLVLSGAGTEREAEELEALSAFCPGADLEVTVLDIPDGRAPAHWDRIKNHLSDFGRSCNPRWCSGRSAQMLIKIIGCLPKLLPTEFRDHLVLGYEILKWESGHSAPDDLSSPEDDVAREKARLLLKHYPSQSRPRLVRRASVSRAVQTSWRAMPQRARGSLHPGEGNNHIRALPQRRARRVRGRRMRVLVTGHQGYLGTVMVPILQAAGHDVIGLDSGFLRRLRARQHPEGPACHPGRTCGM